MVTKVTLDIQPAFTMRQDVYENLPLAQLTDHFDEHHVERLQREPVHRLAEQADQRGVGQASRRGGGRAGGRPEFYGATLATRNLHPIVELSAENCTEQMGVPGPWYERLPHFRMGFTPSSGKELQSEYFVPRENAVEAILAIERLRDRVSPHLLISEIAHRSTRTACG